VAQRAPEAAKAKRKNGGGSLGTAKLWRAQVTTGDHET